MTHAELKDQLKHLTLTERLSIIEIVLQMIREDLEEKKKPQSWEAIDRDLEAAAQLLKADYMPGGPLNIFEELEGEDFYEEG